MPEALGYSRAPLAGFVQAGSHTAWAGNRNLDPLVPVQVYGGA